MVVVIPRRLVPFHRKVGSLYKKWIRQLQSDIHRREEFLYKSTLARAEFDQILCQPDVRVAKQMYLDKEEEYNRIFATGPMLFPTQPGGVAYKRERMIEDWVLDFWHPLEKAIYPEYFARRELRKQQFMEMWEKLHGPPKPCEDH